MMNNAVASDNCLSKLHVSFLALGFSTILQSSGLDFQRYPQRTVLPYVQDVPPKVTPLNFPNSHIDMVAKGKTDIKN